MSSFFPRSSCNEREREVRDSKIGFMSALDRLATHIRRFVNCESIRSSKSVKASPRGEDREDVLGHSPKASTTRKIGACLGTFSTSFKQRTSLPSLGFSEPSLCSEYDLEIMSQ